MQTWKAVLGYTLAALAIPIVVATFVAMPAWEKALVGATGLRVSPRFTGDEVARSVPHEGYETRIHRPVFEALIGEAREGFVQVDWAPSERLPATLDEEIDYDDDGVADFRVRLESGRDDAVLTPIGREVLGLEGTYRLSDARSVRVALRNKNR